MPGPVFGGTLRSAAQLKEVKHDPFCTHPGLRSCGAGALSAIIVSFVAPDSFPALLG
jgi:hypothetical protein